MKASLIYIIIFLPALACVKPYDFKSPEASRAIVIDASISNQIKSHRARLSFTYALDGFQPEPISGARVWVESENGSEIEFKEQGAGRYATDENATIEIGRGYQLHVQIDEDRFVSDWVYAPNPYPIDSIYGRYMKLPSTVESERARGIQFFVNSGASAGEPVFYRYQWSDAYQIATPLLTPFIWDYDKDTLLARERDVNVCYNTGKSIGRIIASTKGLAENIILDFPLNFVVERSLRLRTFYAIRVNQHSITEEAYNFYKQLKENNESTGSFFDKQKGGISGNIRSETQSQLPVLGYFEVSAVTQKARVFDASHFLTQGLAPSPYPDCDLPQIDTVVYSDLADYISRFQGLQAISNSIQTDTFLVVPTKCSDCRNLGVIQKPEWWEDLDN